MSKLQAILIISLVIFYPYVIVESKDLPAASALYLFGDSLLDAGNNNYLPTIARVNYPPYGIDFPQGSTGRFTNGKTVGDFIDHINTNAKIYILIMKQDLIFVLLGQCLHLDEQVDLFNRTIEAELKKKFNTREELSDYLGNSLLVMYMGNNDYLYYVKANYTKSEGPPRDHQQFSDVLLHQFYNNFQRLYSLGARKIAIFEIGPLGCLPTVIKRFGTGDECVEDVNQVITYFNHKLKIMLSNLTSTLPGSSFALSPSYSLAYDAIKNPTKYGLTDSSKPCCITWANMTATCIPFLPPCPDYQNHFFWDSLHPTEAVNLVTSNHFKNSTFFSLNLV
ncbi:GDSL lipase/esterase [Dillenia turbinata]|uniref:GDSL lipase/esterase n=1 Tax=Dillenia turbinata TaxID=194707 RepID=A0AAN8UIN5_9MAGN